MGLLTVFACCYISPILESSKSFIEYNVYTLCKCFSLHLCSFSYHGLYDLIY